MKKAKTFVLGLFFGLLCVITAVALGLGAIHAFDLLYRIDLKALDIPAYSGIPAEVALRNYRAVMAYLSPFNSAPFSLPDLAFSGGGAQHFADCKLIFNALYLAGAVSFVLMLVIIWAKRRGDKRFLRISGATTLALPVALLAAIAIDFDAAFVAFHKLFFSNDLWVFDWRTDPVITILPQEFFMHCAIVIVAFIVAAAALEFLFARKRGKRAASRQN